MNSLPEDSPSPSSSPDGVSPQRISPADSMWRQIFFGLNGLRAGWRLLIFLAIVAGQIAVVTTILRALRVGGAGGGLQATLTPSGLSIQEGAFLVFVCIASLIMARIEHRKFGEYGLPGRGFLGGKFWRGAMWGFLAISGTLLVIFLLHGFSIEGMAIHGRTLVGATAAWSLTFLIVGLSEEFTFRGYSLFTLATGMGYWPAVVVVSILFALAHVSNQGETVAGVTSVVFFSLLFCLFLDRTGNLWVAVGFHAGWDWGQTFFYGVPDSGLLPYHSFLNSAFHGPRWLTGGTVGPEASVFTPIALAVVAIIFAVTHRENRYRLPASAPGGAAVTGTTPAVP